MTKDKALKLTERQLAVLKELSTKGVIAHYMPYRGRFNPNPYWFLTSTHKKATREIEALHNRGLVDVEHKDSFGEHTTAKINKQGRAALKACWQD